jgi:uncharacterized protein YecE (DUF72 family)
MKKKKKEWHIGCSGFHYNDWKEVFYPKGLPANKWFAYYRDHFNTVESNVTFYRLPLLSTLQKWYDESDRDFRFSVKAPRLVTHYKKFINCSPELEKFYNTIKEGLSEKLACVIFQFGPDFSYTKERLRNIIAGIDSSFNNVIEFRHTSWWDKNVYDQLKDHSLTFCNMSHPKFPEQVISTSPIFYFRFHGSPVLYKSAYSHEYLSGIVEKIRSEKSIETAYLYFNNTWGMGAIENAKYIKSILQKAQSNQEET